MKRREFIVAAAALPIACQAKPAMPPSPVTRYFNAIEAATMEAWLERMLPANVPPGTPGAKDAGVLIYIDGVFTDPKFAVQARAVRRSIARLQQESKPAKFEQLDEKAQIELLMRIQNGQITDHKINMQKAFEIVHELALEGFLGASNKDHVVWASLGNTPACPH